MAEGIEAKLKQRAAELGLSLVGIARADQSRHGAFYERWLERGAHGEMSYLSRPDAVARRRDLSLTLESVRSIVVVGHEYFAEDAAGVPHDPSLGVIARYARGRDYHTVLKKKLLNLLDWLREAEAAPVAGRAYVDTGPILERELGSRAGLGWFGKNTMLLNPRRGSWFFLGCLLLDLELEPDPPFTEDRCGTCTRCLDACPTGALLGKNEEGAPVIDARRCISYLTIENRGEIPRELRPLIGNRIYGCDICQEICPFNERFASDATEPAYAARGPGEPPRGVQKLPSDRWHPGTAAPPLLDLMRMDAAAWESFSRGSAVRRAGRAGFLRNVAVALGNWGSGEAVPVLSEALSNGDPLVRGHAAWALGRIGSEDARAALSAQLSIESDESVGAEITAALDA
jgi:epoxyqueuosine reductase